MCKGCDTFETIFPHLPETANPNEVMQLVSLICLTYWKLHKQQKIELFCAALATQILRDYHELQNENDSATLH